MALNPGGTGNYGWKYSDPNAEGYSLEFWGTVLAIQEVQAREYNPGSNQPGRPRFWPEGNPVLNIRMACADPNGQIKTVTFPEAGKKQKTGEKPSLHWDLYILSGREMTNLIGKTVHIWTWPADPVTGQMWQRGNPRKFGCELVDGVKYELSPGIVLPQEFFVPVLLCNDGAHGGQPAPVPPQQIQAPQAPPMQGQYYAPPTAQQPAYQQAYQQPQQQFNPTRAYQQPMQQAQPPMPQGAGAQPPAPMGAGAQPPMPVTQAMPPQQANAPMPQGMDPAVAAAMQAVGAVNVQPIVDTTGGIYDDDIPFD